MTPCNLLALLPVGKCFQQKKTASGVQSENAMRAQCIVNLFFHAASMAEGVGHLLSR